MAQSVLVDASFLTALLRQRDAHRDWAASQARRFPPPWHVCEAVLSEAFYLLGGPGLPALARLLQYGTVMVSFDLGRKQDSVIRLMEKYADVPMSLADACLVRMTEVMSEPVLLTTDADFRVYRRHSRQVIPVVMPR